MARRIERHLCVMSLLDARPRARLSATMNPRCRGRPRSGGASAGRQANSADIPVGSFYVGDIFVWPRSAPLRCPPYYGAHLGEHDLRPREPRGGGASAGGCVRALPPKILTPTSRFGLFLRNQITKVLAVPFVMHLA